MKHAEFDLQDQNQQISDRGGRSQNQLHYNFQFFMENIIGKNSFRTKAKPSQKI